MSKKPVQGKSKLPATGRVRERGQILIMVALAAIVMFGIVGLAIDVGRLYVARVELGRSLDVAALSGILELNGTPAGLTAAENKAYTYFDLNEPQSDRVTRVAHASPTANELTMDATKSVHMIFLSILGVHNASVSAHAKAGFGTQYLDAVMVLDATPSMNGNPIAQAKNAAITFKNILLGTNPQGNVKVGVTAFRGCFKPSPTPHADCVDSGSWKRDLVHNHSQLETTINAIQGGGNNVATNVCTGLAMGWNIISGPGNHNNQPNNRQYMVILSDGDNAYWGSTTYLAPLGDDVAPRNSNSSPMGTVIGTAEYPCQPYDSCSSPWATAPATPCRNGVHSASTALGSDGFESGNLTGGTGWTGGWTASGNDTPTVMGSSSGQPSPAELTRHLRLRGTGTVVRQVGIAGAAGLALVYSVAWNSLESGDNLLVQVSPNGSSWTTLRDHNTTGDSNHQSISIDLPTTQAFLDATTIWVRFQGSMGDTSDRFYIDAVRITPSSNGYLNGNDGSNPATCEEDPRPRERQIDVRSLNLARAIKQQGVEIFVVAFAGTIPGCNLDSQAIYNDENPAHCNTVLDSTAGPIGNNTHDGTANHRLLKCMSSNTAGSNDHYFYASTAGELTAIFTAIANQIAHRLIE